MTRKMAREAGFEIAREVIWNWGGVWDADNILGVLIELAVDDAAWNRGFLAYCLKAEFIDRRDYGEIMKTLALLWPGSTEWLALYFPTSWENWLQRQDIRPNGSTPGRTTR